MDAMNRISASIPPPQLPDIYPTLQRVAELAKARQKQFDLKIKRLSHGSLSGRFVGLFQRSVFDDRKVILEQGSLFCNRIQRHLHSLTRNFEKYDFQADRVRRHHENLRTMAVRSQEFENLEKGTTCLPKPPYNHMECGCPSIPVKSRSSCTANICERSTTYNLTDSLPVSGGHMTSLRSAVASSCTVTRDNSRGICDLVTHIKMISDNDDDVLNDIQRSWITARREAIYRWNRERDQASSAIKKLMLQIYDDWEHGMSHPTLDTYLFP